MFSESHSEDIEFLQNISIKYVGFRVSAQNEISNYIIYANSLFKLLYFSSISLDIAQYQKGPSTLTNISNISSFFIY